MKPPRKKAEQVRMSTKALERAYDIHRLLKSGRKFTSVELAERFDVSQRTVMRCIEYLRRLEAPIPDPPLPEGYYYLDRKFELPDNLTLEEGEFFAFVMAQKVVQALGPASPYARTLEVSLKKLSRHLAGRLPVYMETLLHEGYEFDLGAVRKVDPAVLQEVDRALSRRAPLDMTYRSLASGFERKQRVVEPYFLRNYKGDWYVVGYCRLAGDMRTFALSRIEGCSVLEDETYEVRPEVDPHRHFENSLGIFATGDPGPCRVWFSPEAARWIPERKWHKSQRVEWNEDGSIVVHLDVGPTLEVVRWVLAHGADARPLAPRSLVDDVDRHIRAMHQRLEEEPPAST